MKNPSEVMVPVSALALPGEKEGQSTVPAAGDTVDITSGTAKVTRIEGEGENAKACLRFESINGAPIDADASEEDKEPSLDDEEDELRQQTMPKGSEKPQIY